MEAIILAGGKGTRLRSIISNLPKPMALVAGYPFLEILLTSLSQKGFTRVVLSLGYMADNIVNYFGYSFNGMEIIYEVEKCSLGTGGAIRLALKQCKNDQVFVMNGDTYLEMDALKVRAQWLQNGNPIILARYVQDVSRYGCLDIKNNRVIGFSGAVSQGPGLINAGCYFIPRNLLDNLNLNSVFSFESDYLVSAVKSECFDMHLTEGKFIDIGVPKDYQLAQVELAKILPQIGFRARGAN